jgi:proline iminopeptidase
VLLSIGSAWAQEKHPVTATKAGEGFVATDDGERIFYRKLGSGEQTVIVPGGLFFGTSLDELSKSRTLILYDLRNRGRSSTITNLAKVSIGNDVRDLETVRAHFGVNKFSPIGWSYLGLMVVLYAKEHPTSVSRIVQIGPVPLKFGTTYESGTVNADDPTNTTQREELERLETQGYPETHAEEYCRKQWDLTRIRLVGDRASVSRLNIDPCATRNEWPLNLDSHFDTLFISISKLEVQPDEITRAVNVPVLTIHGTKDRNAPYGAGREWAAMLPNARLLTVKNAAHAVWADDPSIVSAIDKFLRGEWPEGAEKLKH